MTRIGLIALAISMNACVLESTGRALVDEHGAGGAPFCAEGAGGAGDGCYGWGTSPAKVSAERGDPYPAQVHDFTLFSARQVLEGPVEEVEGVPLKADPLTFPPAQPITVGVRPRDLCGDFGGCARAVGAVSWRWEPAPQLLQFGLFPHLVQLDATCEVLPRPLCEDPLPHLQAARRRIFAAAGYREWQAPDGRVAYVPDVDADGNPLPCMATGCQVRLGRALAEECRLANTWTWDDDGDDAGNACDNCRARANRDQHDRDDDGLGDACDPCPAVAGRAGDDDADGRRDCADNCPEIANAGQADLDGDGEGDACDDDDDGDALSDGDEAAQGTDPRDPDTDGDDLLDGADNCPSDPNPGQADFDGDDHGDVCDLPLVAGDAPRPRATVRWDELLVTDVWMPPPESLKRLGDYRARLQALAAAYGDAVDPVLDAGALLLIGLGVSPSTVGQVLRLFEVLENQNAAVVSLVAGLNYEQWAMNNYCHSQIHLSSGSRCKTQGRMTRWNRDFDDPQPLFDERADGRRIPRSRFADCLCPGVAGRVPPLVIEAKATTNPDTDRFSPSYERHLVEQCLDYRFGVAELYRRAFPEVGSIRDAYAALLQVGGEQAVGRVDDSPRVAPRHRPLLEYRLAEASPAMRRVMELCRFPEQPEDAGLMPHEGPDRLSELDAVTRIRSAAQRLAAQPPEPVSMMRWMESRPGRVRLHDSVRVCGGPPHYFVTPAQADPGAEDPGLQMNVLCLRGGPQEGFGARDGFVRTPMRPGAEWGDLSFPLIRVPVCDPAEVNALGRDLQADLVAHDGIGRVMNAEDAIPFFTAVEALDEAFGPALRIPLDAEPLAIDHVRPGFHVALSEERYLLQFDDTMAIRWTDARGVVQEDLADADARRDRCFD